ncbi:MAG: hypothetical protein Q7S12_00105 [bacterium]|nr:hypothetical protein [bacterium]
MFPKFLKKKYTIILAAVFLLAGAAIWFFGFAPVMSVEGKNVSMGEFSKIKSAISRYDEVSHAVGTSTLPVEVNKRVLGNIIDRALTDELIQKVDSSINQKAIDRVNETVSKNTTFSLADAAEKLYGLSEQDFKDLVLVPLTKKNLLLEHFKDDPGQLNIISDNLVKTANIKIYYPGYSWENGEVKSK